MLLPISSFFSVFVFILHFVRVINVTLQTAGLHLASRIRFCNIFRRESCHLRSRKREGRECGALLEGFSVFTRILRHVSRIQTIHEHSCFYNFQGRVGKAIVLFAGLHVVSHVMR